MVGLSVGSAVGQSSIADEVSNLVRKSKQDLYPTIDEEYVKMEPQTKVDILVATPGRLMDHINMTKGFSLEHLQYLVGLLVTLLHNSWYISLVISLLTLLIMFFLPESAVLLLHGIVSFTPCKITVDRSILRAGRYTKNIEGTHQLDF